MIVVNFSTDKYREGQKRLEQSLYDKGHLNYAMYGEYKQIGSPMHQQSPYEFKIHAMKEAAKTDPKVLWADASIWLNGDIKPIIDLVERDGYYIEESGHLVRDWCNVHTLRYFQLMKTIGYRMPIAGCMAIDFSTAIGKEFIEEWERAAKGGCFKGNWDGPDKHRHDMTVAGILAGIMGMKFQPERSHIFYLGPGHPKAPEDGTFYCQGLV